MIGGNDAGLCAHGSLDVIGKPEGERNDRQRVAHVMVAMAATMRQPIKSSGFIR